MRNLALLLLSVVVIPISAIADTLVFSDGFEGDTVGLNKTNFLNWDVIQGSVDLVGCGATGNCVDMDGSTAGIPGAILRTKSGFSFLAGESYELSFSMPQGTENDPFTVSVGGFVSQSFSGYGFPLSATLAFGIIADGTASIQFEDTALPNYFGPYLTQVTLTRIDSSDGNSVPEPATVALLALAAPFCARFRRRGSSA